MTKKLIEMACGWRPGHKWVHTTLENPWPHFMVLEVSWNGPWALSFGLSQPHGHSPWVMCEAALCKSKERMETCVQSWSRKRRPLDDKESIRDTINLACGLGDQEAGTRLKALLTAGLRRGKINVYLKGNCKRTIFRGLSLGPGGATQPILNGSYIIRNTLACVAGFGDTKLGFADIREAFANVFEHLDVRAPKPNISF